MNKINVHSKDNLAGGKKIKLSDLGLCLADPSASEALLLTTEEGYKILPLRQDIKKLYIEVTTLCNFSCTTCIRNSWLDDMGQMEWTTFERLLDQMRQLPELEVVHFGGFGEPMSHPRFFDMLRDVKALGLRVEMITNGSFLTPENIARLVNLPLDAIFISLDGPDEEEYNQIRQTDFAPVVDNIKALNAAKAAAQSKLPELGIEFVAMKKNFHKLAKLIRLSIELKAHQVIVTNVLPYNEEMKDEILYDLDDTQLNHGKDDILVKIHAKMPYMKIRTDRQCKFVEDKAATITYRGEVAPCYALMHAYHCYIYGRKKEMYPFYLGNVNQSTLGDIWTDPAYVNFRSKLKDFKIPSCTDCKSVDGCSYTDTNEADCWGNNPSCADCLWSRRLIACP
ncbi:tungsten cofactor oxidoreductase radical SAM maturase [Desulforamulus aeronauticus]|uniref:Tungsten cofactor oxidoreducase radical SAM maturase n=1 Tax=Desulforamulus aeronauticus DSM 10349 TaxID=1121421 RepID=A0A1M6UZK5_9FIRM|nr:tungsten cofactor oxidoreductase radical SAM maturase [Desulforamulus aeronauticus]SHK73091.1 tungsten cofactor oxidoreducase radical SAM maturase [Desulforamulus aeronauticus DSM 10349]SHK74643.1 tungsten cofactor oxidoreducase radical SAM maturase [Desulforamulus aeronauticus DSM 10349]